LEIGKTRKSECKGKKVVRMGNGFISLRAVPGGKHCYLITLF